MSASCLINTIYKDRKKQCLIKMQCLRKVDVGGEVGERGPVDSPQEDIDNSLHRKGETEAQTEHMIYLKLQTDTKAQG